MPRVVVVDVPHHLTQRGNALRRIFEADADRLVCLDLLRHYCSLSHVSVLSWCLMINHVHLVATPQREDSLPSRSVPRRWRTGTGGLSRGLR